MRQLLRSGKLNILMFLCLTFCFEVSNRVGDGIGDRDQVFVGVGNTGLGTTVVYTTIVVRPGVSFNLDHPGKLIPSGMPHSQILAGC